MKKGMRQYDVTWIKRFRSDTTLAEDGKTVAKVDEGSFVFKSGVLVGDTLVLRMARQLKMAERRCAAWPSSAM